MKIAIAQIQPKKADVYSNKALHMEMIHMAVAEGADVIVFPELSLTSYEPELANTLAIDLDSADLQDFQSLCDLHKIIVLVGAPTLSGHQVLISTLIFNPYLPLRVYSKQHLHPDEYPYFKPGKEQAYIQVKGQKLCLAICYEIFVSAHIAEAFDSGATLYIASVAKSRLGMEKAYQVLSETSLMYHMPVLLCNSLGPCDNFVAAGYSAVWNAQGMLLDQLYEQPGLLIYDSSTQDTRCKV